ncbi:unnamed protein product [Calypogeia fissa]
MVAADSSSSQPAAPLRHDEQEKALTDDGRAPLAVSEKSNGGLRKARNREITSRYKAAPTGSSTAAAAQAAAAAAQAAAAARRHPSPNLGRSLSGGDPSVPKRALSAERRRPWPAATPESKTSSLASPSSSVDGFLQSSRTRLSGRGPELHWPLSQSKEGESSNGHATENAEGKSPRPVSERSPLNNTLKPAANGIHRSVDASGVPPQRKGSPMRRQSTDQTENARPDYLRTKPDLQRWPGSSNGKVFGAAITRSMDLNAERERQSLNRSSTFTTPGRTVTSSGYGVVSSGYGSSSVSRPARPTASSLIASARNFTRSVNEGPVGSVSVSSRSSTPERRARSRTAVEPPPKTNEKPRSESANSRESSRESSRDSLVRKSSLEAVPAVLAGSDSQPGAVDTISDSESVSSGGSGTGSRMSSTKGTTVPARVWQVAEASRSRRLSEGNRLRSSMSEQDLSSAIKAARKLASMGTTSNANTSSSAWSLSSARNIIPITSSQPPVSPARGRGGSSPLRGLPSPTRTRPPPPNGTTVASRTPSISTLNFGTDLRSRGKKAMSQQEEALLLRILHNRYLQWRFINARADTALQSQRAAAEKSLYNVWIKTSELRASVATQRMKLQQAKHFHKLKTILSHQAPQLQSWASLKNDHAAALFGVVEALEASILRVPVTGGARADVQAVKDALGSAVDVMNAVELSVKNLLPKAQSMDTLVAELADTAAQERALLAECGELLSIAASLEIEERSLSTHLVQIQHERNRPMTTGSLDSLRLGST